MRDSLRPNVSAHPNAASVVSTISFVHYFVNNTPLITVKAGQEQLKRSGSAVVIPSSLDSTFYNHINTAGRGLPAKAKRSIVDADHGCLCTIDCPRIRQFGTARSVPGF